MSAIDTIRSDVQYALRSLRASPTFALVAVLSLGLGIGANTAIFSLLNAVMLKTLPVAHPEQLVSVVRDADGEEFTNPLWEAIRDRQDMFAGMLAFGDATFSLTDGGEARRINATWVSGDYFTTLGVAPAHGRLFTRADDTRGCAPTTVLDYGFWQREYAGNAAVVGTSIAFNGQPFTIIGIAPHNFLGANIGQRPAAYVPLCSNALFEGTRMLDGRSYWMLNVMARIKPGMTAEQVRARFAMLAPSITEATLPNDWPDDALTSYRKMTFDTRPAAGGFSALRGQYQAALIDLMVVVALVLLVACANVANLLLSRATARRHETAVRLALGAGRVRLARQFITESLLLSVGGTLVGFVFAGWGSRVLIALLSRSNHAIGLDLTPDARMLAFTIVVTVLAALVFGVAPAWQVSQVDPQSAMKVETRGTTSGASRLWTAKALVVAQIAISLVLIMAAGLVVGSWRRLATLDPGFRREHVLLVTADLRNAQLAPDARDGAVRDVLDRIRAIPGVHSAATVAITPISGFGWNNFVQTDLAQPTGRGKGKGGPLSWFNAVSEDYFKTLGIPLIEGQDFTGSETQTSEKVAIVNQAMARKFFGPASPIGRTYRTREGNGLSAPVRVIGVVGNTKYRSLRDTAAPTVYLPRSQQAGDEQSVNVALYTEATQAVLPEVKRAFAVVSPRVSLDFTTLDRQLAESMPIERATATVSGFFGVLAVLLAAMGLYGIMSYSVNRRRNEIGVRIALGASYGRIVRMVLADVGAIMAAGIVVGIAVSLVATRLVSTLIYDVKPNDPGTLIGAIATLVMVGLLAAALPAWRAARVDPVKALR